MDKHIKKDEILLLDDFFLKIKLLCEKHNIDFTKEIKRLVFNLYIAIFDIDLEEKYD